MPAYPNTDQCWRSLSPLPVALPEEPECYFPLQYTKPFPLPLPTTASRTHYRAALYCACRDDTTRDQPSLAVPSHAEHWAAGGGAARDFISSAAAGKLPTQTWDVHGGSRLKT